ncbi:hypothetical protein [Nostoc sp.]|uniref:hypothetical protein n=1 Tax=Nostoc sp. TaxID=1180 RepID=UPI002FFBBD1F
MANNWHKRCVAMLAIPPRRWRSLPFLRFKRSRVCPHQRKVELLTFPLRNFAVVIYTNFPHLLEIK